MTLRDPETGKPVPAFATIHERLLHLFIIDRTLEYFAHMHPETGRRRGLRDRPSAGDLALYVLIADFLPLTARRRQCSARS